MREGRKKRKKREGKKRKMPISLQTTHPLIRRFGSGIGNYWRKKRKEGRKGEKKEKKGRGM